MRPVARVFVYIVRNNTLALRQEVSTALIRIMGIYYTQHSPPSELLANVLPHETYSADVIVLKFESLSSRCLCL